MKRDQKGFTLIELMIVVAIIGILAAVAIPKFAEMMERSRDGATKGNIAALRSAISIYYGDHEGKYPTDLTAVQPGGESGTGTGWNFQGKYIDDVPPVKSQGGNKTNTASNPNKCPWGGSNNSSKLIDYHDFSYGTAPSINLGSANSLATGYKYESLTGLIWINATILDMNSKPFSMYGYD